MDYIQLENMHFFAYHGVFPEETKLGQRFRLNVSMAVDLRRAGETDDLQETINYADTYETVRAIVEGKPFKLIEALAEHVASELFRNYTRIQEITVKVTKPDPPFAAHFDGVSIQITRKRPIGDV